MVKIHNRRVIPCSATVFPFKRDGMNLPMLLTEETVRSLSFSSPNIRSSRPLDDYNSFFRRRFCIRHHPMLECGAREREREYGSSTLRRRPSGPPSVRRRDCRRGPPPIVIVSIHLSYHNLDCLINSGSSSAVGLVLGVALSGLMEWRTMIVAAQ